MNHFLKKWISSIAVCIAVIFLAGIGLPVADVKSADNPNVKNKIVKLDERLGVKPGAILAELSAHESDGYYLGTPYDSEPFTEENCMRPNGASGGKGGMNCTGFVASVFSKCGADLSGIASWGLPGGRINASNWFYWITENAVEVYHYQTIGELLKSGKAQKGDVVYFEPISWNEPDADCHIGFFWGNSGNDNKFWHSATKPGQGNQISELTTKSPSTVYLFKITHTGDVEIRKSSADPELTEGNRCYSLEGAEYTLYPKGTVNVAAVITTDKNGYGKASGIEAGVYDIKETKAPNGYAVNGQTGSITVNAGETAVYSCVDTAKRASMELLLEKMDAETGEKIPQGRGSFTGAEFAVKYYDVIKEKDPGAEGIKPLRTWVFRTDEEGKAYFADDYLVEGDPLYADSGNYVLPLGTVTIREIRAPEGYRMQEEIFVRTISEEKGNVSEIVSCFPVLDVKESIMRGDLELIKAEDGTLKRMEDIPFRITSKTTGESHVIVTDKNGYVSTSSEWNSHKGGIWFGKGEPDDAQGALLYDTYIVEEIECRQNEEHCLIPPFEVQIYRDRTTVKLGTLTNDVRPVPEIGTSAYDQDSGTHQGIARKEAVIIDVVSYRNLVSGREYTIKGVLMDAESGEKLLVNGECITAETTFTAEKEEGSVEMVFKLDASGMNGMKTVVFENLYFENKKVAGHEDIHDKEQTIAYESSEPEMPETKKPDKKIPETITPVRQTVKTGDEANLIVLIFCLLVSCATVIKCVTMGAWRRARK